MTAVSDEMHAIAESALFSDAWYLEAYPDVGTSGLTPLDHFVRIGANLGRDPHPLFSTSYYLAQLTDKTAKPERPLLHYLQGGWRMGLNPHPLFDVAWYLAEYPDVARAGVEPLGHYLVHGYRELRSPHPRFPIAEIVARVPALKSGRDNPLLYYLTNRGSIDPCPTATEYLAKRTGGWRPPGFVGLPRIENGLSPDVATVEPLAPAAMAMGCTNGSAGTKRSDVETVGAVEVYGHVLRAASFTQAGEHDPRLASTFVEIIVYADESGPRLRATLESIAASRGLFGKGITVICDWPDAEVKPIDPARGVAVSTCITAGNVGFYASVAEAIRRAREATVLVIRAGVVLGRNTIADLLTAAVVRAECDVLAPVTENTPHLGIRMKPGDNVHTMALRLGAINDADSIARCVVPSEEVFLITPQALRSTPFPHWLRSQDSSPASLIRFFAALADRQIRIGVLVTTFAQSLLPAAVSDEQRENAVEAKHADRYRELTRPYIARCGRLRDAYQANDPVIAMRPTVIILVQGLTLAGGVIVLVNLANDLVLRGCNVRLYYRTLTASFRDSVDLLFEPKQYSPQHLGVIDTDAPGDALVIATLWTTARDVEQLVADRPGRHGVYFIQDYEPRFYSPESADEQERRYHDGALDSYRVSLSHVYTSDWIGSQIHQASLLDFRSALKCNVGIDHSVFPPRFLERTCGTDREIVVGAMARPSTPRRGYPLLIAAMKKVKEQRPETKVLFFGAADYSGHDGGLVYENAGVVKPRDLAALYSRMDIFVDSSDFQGFGLCPLEAMTTGCACVLTDSGGVSEYAIHDENALIVPHDACAIAAAIIRLIDDASLRRKLGARGAATAQDFDRHRLAECFVEMAERMDGRSQARPRAAAVIVPVHNGLEVVRQCLESVLPSLRPCDRLVVVDDCSDHHTAAELEKYTKRDERVVLLKNERNLGFVGSVNRGLDYADRATLDVILLNSDTIVPPGWIDRLERVAYGQSDPPAMVSPLATESSHLRLELQPGDSFASANKWLQSRTMPPPPEVITPEGWCLYIPLEIVRVAGKLDTCFGRGYCEESDLCMRAYAAGYGLKICEDVLIHHFGKISFGDEKGSLYQHNRRIFDRRWSSIYQTSYRRFLHRNPLQRLRRDYEHSTAWAGSKLQQSEEFDDLVAVLGHPATPVNIDRVQALSTPVVDRHRPPARSVAFLLPEIAPYGGVLSVVMLANSLIRLGCDAKIVYLKTSSADGEELGSLAAPLLLPNYGALLDGFPEVDLVVATGWITVYYAAHVLAVRRNMRLAYYVQDYEPDFPDVAGNPRLRAAARRTYTLGIKSFSKTRWIAKKVADAEGGFVKVVLPAVDVDRFYPRTGGASARPWDVLAMLRPHTPQRGYHTVLDTLRLIKRARPQTAVCVFGSDRLPESVVAEGFIDHNLGVVTNRNLPGIYSQAKVFLEASFFHGFGRTIAEAMACGAGCVITRSGGPEEFCVDGMNALLCGVGESERLAQKALKLLEDENTRDRLTNNARRTIEAFEPMVSARGIAEYLGVATQWS